MAQQEMSEEQMQALQERIKNMSPQELKEFQKKQCIFCQIVAGKIAAKKIYEDELVLGILDINPANPGHVLLLPKEHYSIMPQIPEDEIGHIFKAAKHLSNSMLRSIEAQGTNIIVANGVAAGQRAQHFMVHIIPRKENDGVSFTLPQKTIGEDVLEQAGNRIISAISGKAPEEIMTQKPVQLLSGIKDKAQDQRQAAPHHQKDEGLNSKAGTKKHEQGPKESDDGDESKAHAKKGSKGAKSTLDLDDIAKLLGAK